jgi:phosphoheptose isomerase/UTP-glucose-1-phosphate uridylyltransferase
MLRDDINAYLRQLSLGIEQLDRGAIEQVALELLGALRRERAVFLIGNGGSAATASHIAVDLSKLIVPGHPRFRAIALTDNVPVITAWANDTHYDHVFSEQLRNLCQPGDLVIAISCSGNSPNVLNGARVAREMGARVVGFTGDGGGALAGLVDVCVHAPLAYIGQQEDIHMILDHLLVRVMHARLLQDGASGAQPARAIILAAGGGTRMLPLTLHTPKPLLPVAGKPVLTHIIEWLRGHGVRDLAINLHHHADAIVATYEDGSELGVRITYSREETLLGTSGAVRKLADFAGDQPLIVAYGDVLADFDLGALMEFHRRARESDPQTAATLCLYHVSNPTEVGLVDLDAAGRITRFVEKPAPDEVFTDLASAGVLIVEPRAIQRIPPDTFHDFGRDLFPQLLREGLSLYGWVTPPGSRVIDMGTPAKYALARREWSVRDPRQAQPASAAQEVA